MDWMTQYFKVSTLSKLILRFNTISIKIQVIFFIDIDKIIQNFIWKDKGARIAKVILKKKNELGNDHTQFQDIILIQ